MDLDTVSKPVPPQMWGKDHWSLLAYVSTCYDGEIDRRHMRCNEQRHPLLSASLIPWDDKYSTRLKTDSTSEGDSRILGHDDWDCLEDLEAAGLVEIVSEVNGFVLLTKKGNEWAFALREHKNRGGSFADFQMPCDGETNT